MDDGICYRFRYSSFGIIWQLFTKIILRRGRNIEEEIAIRKGK